MKVNKTHKKRSKKNATQKNKKTYLMLQYDNRKLSKNIEILTKINQKYCSLYGYDYILDVKEYNLPPYWIKVKLAQELLNTNKYKGILWMDTDAVVDNFSISLESICLPNKSIYYSFDNDSFNAGVWLLLNDKVGKNIINEWATLYNPSKWQKVQNKWLWSGKIQNIRDGWNGKTGWTGWAGSDFEQGQFKKVIIPKYKKYCYQYYQSFFQNNDIDDDIKDKPVFSYHFYGKNKQTTLPIYLKAIALTIKSVTTKT